VDIFANLKRMPQMPQIILENVGVEEENVPLKN